MSKGLTPKQTAEVLRALHGGMTEERDDWKKRHAEKCRVLAQIGAVVWKYEKLPGGTSEGMVRELKAILDKEGL